MKSPRQRVHDAFRAAERRGQSDVPCCVWKHRYAEHVDLDAISHTQVCDELTEAVAFDRLMVRHGHYDEAHAASEPGKQAA